MIPSSNNKSFIITITAILSILLLSLATYFSLFKTISPYQVGDDSSWKPPSPIRMLDSTSLAAVKSVIIEIGTNDRPDFHRYARQNPDAMFLMVEPITAAAALTNGCRHMEHRCAVISAAVTNFNGYANFRVGAASACSSLLAGGKGCARKSGTMLVSTMTLDSLIDEIPEDLPIELLVIDCQGVDFYVLSQLRRHLHRVANIIFECQDTTTEVGGVSSKQNNNNDAKIHLYQNKKAKNCGQIFSCIQKYWPKQWKHTTCTHNMIHVKEVNCVFVNTAHSLANLQIRHPYRNDTSYEITKSDTKCPDKDWNSKVSFN